MDLGRKLWIRSLVNVSAEPIPYFWPMRTFVHHNPLHELEELSFWEAVREGERIFGGRGFLSREGYQYLMERGRIREEYLRNRVVEFLEEENLHISGLDTAELVVRLITDRRNLNPRVNRIRKDIPEDLVEFVLGEFREDPAEEMETLFTSVGKERTLYEAIDELTGSDLSSVIDDLVARSMIGFLDEGQAAVAMPRRELGLFRAWKELAKHNVRFLLRAGFGFWKLVQKFEEPEEAIEYVLQDLNIPEYLWSDYITRELSRLKGIVGFLRWRQHNRDYFWQKKYPADVVDYAAVRLIIVRAVLSFRARSIPFGADYRCLEKLLREDRKRAYLMREYFSGRAVPRYAEKLPEYFKNPESIIEEYLREKALWNAKVFLSFLYEWLSLSGIGLEDIGHSEVLGLVKLHRRLQEKEGVIWLKAMEDTLLESLVSGMKPVRREEDKVAQALFCIDVRSERFRRNLEALGGYETHGIAGFFGVPMAFVELEKGHEEFLCPVILRPGNVVLELPVRRESSTSPKGAVEEIFHDLKENVLTPFVTVEAIGFLFGFDFIGKTFLPTVYSRAREKVLERKPPTRLLLEKLGDEEIEHVVKSVLGAIVRVALDRELGIKADVRTTEEVLETILEGKELCESLPVSEERQREFFKKLRTDYRVDRGSASLIREKLKHVGFSLEEQAALIAVALKSIGLVKDFAPIVLVLGHGSRSENNPYESALDCGACGGASGTHNARAFCVMANNPKVRTILRERFGIDIPESTYFVPGLHNTTTDEIKLYDLELLPPKLLPLLERIEEDLRRAGETTALERAKELGVGQVYRKVVENAYDWSQVRPEWGLSGNYAFIIGRRELTAGMNLGGKVFLHSYDYKVDPKGFLLENILSGPLVVGQWINMEHYFSTTDNEVYGSGSKVYHNVAGRIGVMTGNLSDLRTGLPAQTVLKKGKPFHTPVRLIALIEAPLEFVKKVVGRVHKIRELVHKEWINMVVLDPERNTFYRFMDGDWVEIKSISEEVKT
ncbi:hypothetical protein BCF55_1507 [Hydrogenivirga caldilitoris]|uniref:Probable inorganic carbon transporter subunit DabA n=1 Tax=Hydrogenivirga caldilitoris TaxID=246264 RepID=A0A497XQN6_9AQUI|nr:DUF2309 domain-containing protein [Hydrogenivirga caldilitoris]RLJ71208.1 hypothetical protein BCF55_1507 [Hydrogenivirga caldilitoris]